MSGTGQNNNAAPTRLTPVALDQAIGFDGEGRDVMPAPWFGQMLQRLLSSLGQPGTGTGGAGGGSGQTVFDQITDLQQSVKFAEVGIGSATPGLVGRVSALEKLWKRRNPIASALAQLFDTRIQSPADGDGLTYHAASRRWQNGPQGNLWNPCVSLMPRIPLDFELLFEIVLSYPAFLPQGLPHSYGRCNVAPTFDSGFFLFKNIFTGGVVFIGDAIILAGQTDATFDFPTDVTFAEGDTFTFAAPTPPDPTMQGIFFSFKGSRT